MPKLADIVEEISHAPDNKLYAESPNNGGFIPTSIPLQERTVVDMQSVMKLTAYLVPNNSIVLLNGFEIELTSRAKGSYFEIVNNSDSELFLDSLDAASGLTIYRAGGVSLDMPARSTAHVKYISSNQVLISQSESLFFP